MYFNGYLTQRVAVAASCVDDPTCNQSLTKKRAQGVVKITLPGDYDCSSDAPYNARILASCIATVNGGVFPGHENGVSFEALPAALPDGSGNDGEGDSFSAAAYFGAFDDGTGGGVVSSRKLPASHYLAPFQLGAGDSYLRDRQAKRANVPDEQADLAKYVIDGNKFTVPLLDAITEIPWGDNTVFESSKSLKQVLFPHFKPTVDDIREQIVKNFKTAGADVQADVYNLTDEMLERKFTIDPETGLSELVDPALTTLIVAKSDRFLPKAMDSTTSEKAITNNFTQTLAAKTRVREIMQIAIGNGDVLPGVRAAVSACEKLYGGRADNVPTTYNKLRVQRRELEQLAADDTIAGKITRKLMDVRQFASRYARKQRRDGSDHVSITSYFVDSFCRDITKAFPMTKTQSATICMIWHWTLRTPWNICTTVLYVGLCGKWAAGKTKTMDICQMLQPEAVVKALDRTTLTAHNDSDGNGVIYQDDVVQPSIKDNAEKVQDGRIASTHGASTLKKNKLTADGNWATTVLYSVRNDALIQGFNEPPRDLPTLSRMIIAKYEQKRGESVDANEMAKKAFSPQDPEFKQAMRQASKLWWSWVGTFWEYESVGAFPAIDLTMFHVGCSLMLEIFGAEFPKVRLVEHIKLCAIAHMAGRVTYAFNTMIRPFYNFEDVRVAECLYYAQHSYLTAGDFLRSAFTLVTTADDRAFLASLLSCIKSKIKMCPHSKVPLVTEDAAFVETSLMASDSEAAEVLAPMMPRDIGTGNVSKLLRDLKATKAPNGKPYIVVGTAKTKALRPLWANISFFETDVMSTDEVAVLNALVGYKNFSFSDMSRPALARCEYTSLDAEAAKVDKAEQAMVSAQQALDAAQNASLRDDDDYAELRDTLAEVSATFDAVQSEFDEFAMNPANKPKAAIVFRSDVLGTLATPGCIQTTFDGDDGIGRDEHVSAMSCEDIVAAMYFLTKRPWFRYNHDGRSSVKTMISEVTTAPLPGTSCVVHEKSPARDVHGSGDLWLTPHARDGGLVVDFDKLRQHELSQCASEDEVLSSKMKKLFHAVLSCYGRTADGEVMTIAGSHRAADGKLTADYRFVRDESFSITAENPLEMRDRLEEQERFFANPTAPITDADNTDDEFDMIADEGVSQENIEYARQAALRRNSTNQDIWGDGDPRTRYTAVDNLGDKIEHNHCMFTTGMPPISGFEDRYVYYPDQNRPPMDPRLLSSQVS